MTLGEAIRTLRGTRKRTQIGREALGSESTQAQRREFSNYLGRIESDKVPNVGIIHLRLMAAGFGFGPTLHGLSAFFDALDAVSAGRTMPAPGHSPEASPYVDPLSKDTTALAIALTGGLQTIADNLADLVRSLERRDLTPLRAAPPGPHARGDVAPRDRKPA
jgi:hypothetical protein